MTEAAEPIPYGMAVSVELQRPGKLGRILTEIVYLGPASAPKPDAAKPKMPGAVPTNRHKTESDLFRTGFGVCVRPRSKPSQIRDSSAEVAQWRSIGRPLDPNPLRSFFQNPMFEVQTASSLRESQSTEVGGFAPHSLDGLSGGRGRLDHPKIGFENNFSMGWVAARGPSMSVTPNSETQFIFLLTCIHSAIFIFLFLA